jgi:ElaA protein
MESTKPLLHWNWYEFTEMSSDILYDMLALREGIFVVEQACVYHELDGRDKNSLHLVATQTNQVYACLRLLRPTAQDNRVKIGRVAVAMDWRGKGIARDMIQMAISKAQNQYPTLHLYLEAQTYLLGFYESMGFKATGPEFLEDGIPHFPMQPSAQL